MSDVLKMQLDIQNNLEKDVQKSSKAMKGFNSLIEDAREKFKETAKSIDKGIIDPLRKVRNILSEIVPLVGTIFSGAIIMDSIRNVLRMDKAITQLSFRMGHGAEGTHALKSAVYSLNAELGIGIENAQELVSELVRLRIPLDMINQMAKSVGLLSEITGISKDEAAELGGNLVRIGRLGQDSVDGIFASMVGVQRAVGLTTDEMNLLSRTISSSTQMLNQLNKSAGEIEKYNRGVIKLAAAFASVGVEAGKVLQIMDELLDPGEVEKHAFLLSKLGVSLGDAFEGNIDPEQLISGFRDLGKTLQGMTGPAAAAMAQQLGMSVRDLRQMGQLGDGELSKIANAMADGASASEAMSSAFKDQETPLQRFERAMERIKGFIGELAEKAMPHIERFFVWISEHAETIMKRLFSAVENFKGFSEIAKTAVPLLIVGLLVLFKFMRRQFRTVATDTSQYFTQGVSEGLKQGAKKGALSMRKEFAKTEGIDLRVRTEKGAGFKGMIEDAELLETRASRMGGFFGNVMRKTARIERNLAASTRPVSVSSEKVAAMGKTMATNLEIAKNEASMIEGALQSRIQAYKQDTQSLQSRMQFLKTREKEKTLTGEEAYQMVAIEKVFKRNYQLRLEAENKLAKEREYNIRKQDRLLSAQTNEQLINLGLIQEKEISNANQQLTELKKRQDEEQARYSLLVSAEEELQQNFKEGLITRLDFVKQQDELAALTKEIEDSQGKTTLEIQEQKNIVAEKEKSMERINNILKDRGTEISQGALAIERTASGLGRAGTFLAQAGRNISTSMGQAIDNFIKGAKDAASAFAERFRRENIDATLREAVRGAASGVGRGAMAVARGAMGAMGGLLKVLGPIALIAGILKNMEPVQKALASIQEKVQNALQRVISTLGPVIDELIESLMPVVDSIIDFLVPILQKVFSALSPLIEAMSKISGPLLDGLMQLITPLINALLPFLIRGLGRTVTFIGRLITGIARLTKFIMELPERFVFHLPRMMGGKGARRDNLSKEEEERLKHLESSLDISYRSMNIGSSARQERRRLRDEIKAITGGFQASEELRSNSVYRAMSNFEEVGKNLIHAGKDLSDFDFDNINVEMKDFSQEIEDGVANGMARNEIRRTWEPAQIRALRDGTIETIKPMTETLSGASSFEEQAAQASIQTALSQQELVESSNRQNEISETLFQREEERHTEVIAALNNLANAINRTPSAANNAAGLSW